MSELSGLGNALSGFSTLYWTLSLALLGLVLWKGKRVWKIVGAAAVMLVFGYLPTTRAMEQGKKDAYARDAWAYFKKKCETEAGERIFSTFTGVKSILVLKPLPPATEKNLFDQFWYGDPYSNDSALGNRGELHAGTLIRNQKFKDGRGNLGFEFFEHKVTTNGHDEYQRVEPSNTPPYFLSRVIVEKPVSRFGIVWEDISTSGDRKYWVAGSRLRLIDLVDQKIIAERIGYFIESGFGSTAGSRRPWQSSRGANTTCPSIENRDFSDRWFVLKVLSPIEGGVRGK